MNNLKLEKNFRNVNLQIFKDGYSFINITCGKDIYRSDLILIDSVEKISKTLINFLRQHEVPIIEIKEVIMVISKYVKNEYK